MHIVFVLLEAMVLTAALSVDAFAAAFAYGSNKINIPARSMHAINFICAGFLTVSLLLGRLISVWLPTGLAAGMGFAILFLLGFYKLAGSIVRMIVQRNRHFCRDFEFTAFDLKFILHLCANPQAADIDGSRVLTLGEAAALAVALSLDGLAVGFGAAMSQVNKPAVILCSLVVGFVALWLGSRLGNGVAKKLPFNLSWLGGALLMGLAVAGLF
ncbi:MAG: manganese efflux pump [Oscillospiraceae bacterium]|nr:manganese efflux pump [Oscillospiraceae bacterium]